MHAAVLGETDEPPVEPVDGDCWIVGAAATDVWSGHQGSIAMRQSGQWMFAEPRAGMRVFALDSGQFCLFSVAWEKPAEIEEPSEGIVVDSQARAAIGAMLQALRATGILPSA